MAEWIQSEGCFLGFFLLLWVFLTAYLIAIRSTGPEVRRVNEIIQVACFCLLAGNFIAHGPVHEFVLYFQEHRLLSLVAAVFLFVLACMMMANELRLGSISAIVATGVFLQVLFHADWITALFVGGYLVFLAILACLELSIMSKITKPEFWDDVKSKLAKIN